MPPHYSDQMSQSLGSLLINGCSPSETDSLVVLSGHLQIGHLGDPGICPVIFSGTVLPSLSLLPNECRRVPRVWEGNERNEKDYLSSGSSRPQFGQIHFAILTNTFCLLDKYSGSRRRVREKGKRSENDSCRFISPTCRKPNFHH